MAYTPEIKLAVRRSYVQDMLPLSDACARHEIPYNTGRRWKRDAHKAGDDWDRARDAWLMASGGSQEAGAQVLETFALLFKSTIEQITNGQHNGIEKAESMSRLADAYTKTIKATTAHHPKLNKLAIALEVLELQTQWIRENRPEKLGEWAAIIEPFGQHLNRMLK